MACVHPQPLVRRPGFRLGHEPARDGTAFPRDRNCRSKLLLKPVTLPRGRFRAPYPLPCRKLTSMHIDNAPREPFSRLNSGSAVVTAHLETLVIGNKFHLFSLPTQSVHFLCSMSASFHRFQSPPTCYGFPCRVRLLDLCPTSVHSCWTAFKLRFAPPP